MSTLTLAHSVTTPAAHNLASRAMLCTVRISMWSARKIDRRATLELTESHGASADAGRFNKLLIAKESLARIIAVAGAARTAHHHLTSPWLDDGPRILPSALFQRHAKDLREKREAFESSVTEFTQAYPVLRCDAARTLGTLYNANDYPSESEIRSRFGFRVSFSPLPDAKDFRVDLEADQLAAIRRDIEQERADVLDSTVQATVNRMRETLESMVARLAAYRTPEETGGRAVGAFHKSVVESVRDLVDLLPAFNLTNDSRITDLANRMRAELCAHDAAELKESPDLRRDTVKAAEDILAQVGAFFA